MRRLLAVLTLTMFAATACGTTERPDTRPGTSTSAGPVSVTDARGRTIQLPAPATRVIGLEWGEVEMLVSLGVMPVGVSDIEGYGNWVTAAKLDPAVKDVGTRGEPSVDSVVALRPDLVVMEAERDSPMVSQLERFVPVLVTKGSDARDNLARMRDDLLMIATAVGKTEQAQSLLSNLDRTLAEGRQKIEAAGTAARPFAMADGWKQGSSISIRMFGQGALVSQVALRLGLTNSWTGTVDEVWGLGNTDVEGLSSLRTKELHFFYNASDGDDVFADGLAGNPLWTSMAFVQQKRVHRMPDGVWTFGGPLSCQQFAAELVRVYTG